MAKRIVLLFAVCSLLGTGALMAQPAQSSRGYLGVNLRDVTPQDVTDLKLPKEAGVYVERVAEGSPAEKAGLAAKDVVVEFAGMPVWSVRQLQRMVAETPPDREVEIGLIRNGERIRKTAKIGESDAPVVEGFGNGRNFRFQMPQIPDMDNFDFQVQPFGRGRGGVIMNRRPLLGIQGTDLTAQMAEFLGVPGKEGVLVMDVRADSPAAKAGLRAGDVIVAVNGKSVESMTELSSEVRDGGDLSLDLVRDKKRQSLKVTIEQPRSRDRGDGEEPARL